MRNINSKYTSVALFCAIAALSVFLPSCKNEGSESLPSADVPALMVSVAEGDENVPLKENTKVDLFAVATDGKVLAKATATSDNQGQLKGTESITAVMQDGVQLVSYSPTGLWLMETYNQPIEFAVPADQTSLVGYQSADLMMAPLVSVTDGKAALVMNHAMTKVTVHITDVTGNYDLSKAVLVLTGVNTSVTADLLQNTVTTLDDKTGDIYPYAPSVNSFRTSATAIVAPKQVKRGTQLVKVILNGKEYTYSVPEDAEWQAGKENVYSMRLTYEGLVPYSSTVIEWGEGNTSLTGPVDEIVSYGMGDYLLSDGNFAKADRLTDAQKSKVVAIVFSEEVSEADREAGYNAYAMGIECVTGKKYGFTDLVGEEVADYTVAIEDLDGCSKTKLMMESDGYIAVTDKQNTIFGCLEAYGQSHVLPSTEIASGWFVPSFGQMIQILNNLGGANLSADTEVTPSNFNPIYQSDDKTILEKINVSVSAVIGDKELISTSQANVYATTTEYGTNFWCVQTLATGWAFGRNPGRANGNRCLIPCVAVKLP